MRKTVMIVDDQPGIRLLLEEVIKSEGYQTIMAENGREALDKIEKHSPDLLIIDYKLPVMDAVELLELLVQRGKTVPTILMSGLAEELEERREELPMVEEIFAKPFNIEDARSHVNRILAGK